MKRHGYTLVEIIVALAVISGVLASATWVLHRMHRAERQVRDRTAESLSVQQLSDRLREDAHASQGAELEAGDPARRRLVLTQIDNRRVSYFATDSAIVREVRVGEILKHRDHFPLAAQSATWEIDASGDRPLVTLQVETMHIEACVGLFITSR